MHKVALFPELNRVNRLGLTIDCAKDSDGYYHGAMRFYKADAKRYLYARCEFVHGVPHGTFRIYRKNGTIITHYTIVDGVEEGLLYCCMRNGKKMFETIAESKFDPHRTSPRHLDLYGFITNTKYLKHWYDNGALASIQSCGHPNERVLFDREGNMTERRFFVDKKLPMWVHELRPFTEEERFFLKITYDLDTLPLDLYE